MTVRPSLGRIHILLASIAIAFASSAAVAGQEPGPPTLRAGVGADDIEVDGLLHERAWAASQTADQFLQTEPAEGDPPSVRTVVRVLASETTLVIGVVCEDRDPAGLVSYSVGRDAVLDAEDHVRIVLGPFLDGRSGYVFAVNPSGARYDGLINAGVEGDNAAWDGIWEAATAVTADGWSLEVRIPVQSLSFKAGLREWHFNVQRWSQRLLERNRWAYASRQYQVTQTSRAGLLTDLPNLSQGLGLTVRPAITTGGGVSVDGKLEPSLDLSQRVGPNVLVSATVNTDFAETEVDVRRTNLTRFPLFYPEKRSFFLEGSDTFQFGLLPNRDVIPYFSRRIGLVDGTEVPIIAGVKVDGRAAATNFGGLVVHTGSEPDVVSNGTTMAVGRVKQNLWRESWIGGVATVGDPLGRTGSWLLGGDFTYATSRFRGDKNLLIGGWLVATGREDLGNDNTAQGIKIDYPNDKWNALLWYKRIGSDFDPSVGFVPRRGVHLVTTGLDNRIRPASGLLQDVVYGMRVFVAADLARQWENYRVTLSPVEWVFRSGDGVQVEVAPEGERLVVPFEIADGVEILPGEYHWRRYATGVTTAQKRRLRGAATWAWGTFYDGQLNRLEMSAAWTPTPLYTVELTGEFNDASLGAGQFRQTLVGGRLQVNISPDLFVASLAQYDTESRSVGVNTRLRWTFRPVGDLFVVYNHNVRSMLDRWDLESSQLLVKMQYAFRL